MSLIDTVNGWADNASGLGDSIGSWWQSLPNVTGPLMFLKAANSGIDTAISLTQGVPLAPAFTRSASGFISGGTLGESVRDNGASAVGVVAGVGNAVADAVTSAKDAIASASSSAPGGLPLWIKFTIIGAVLVGTAVILKSTFSGGTSHAG